MWLYVWGVKFLRYCSILFFSPSVSSLSRLFDDNALSGKLNRRQRRILYRCLQRSLKKPSRYLFAIDDTLIQHHGKKIWGTYYWHDHNTNGTTYGHKLLVLGLVDTHKKVLIPIYWEILHRKGSSEKAFHEKGWEVAFRLLNEAVAFGFPKAPVVLDSWFSGNEFFDQLTSAGFRFVIEIKSNRKINRYGRQFINQPVTQFFSNRFRHKITYLNRAKWAASAILKLNGATQKLKIVAVANKKGLVHPCFAYYASNQLAWDTTKIWGIARDRWTIEVQFRDLKQNFALGEAAVRSQQAVEISLSISMIALTVIRLQQLRDVDTKENQHKRPIPVTNIIQQYQLQSLRKGIFKLASNNATEIIKKFRSRLNPKNFGKKPTEVFQPM